MIFVTGTKRSGTSLWMQILKGAGFPVLGEAFPGEWEVSIRDANPRGFYESRLRQGVFYATNPDPKSGAFLFPKDTRRHVVKVFIPGLARSDYAYLDRVVATVRSWRDYGPSIDKLYALEDEHLAAKGDELVEKVRKRRPQMAPHEEWFMENYELIRDFSARKFPLKLHAYERLLAEPERIVGDVLQWLGGGDLQGALAAIEPGMHRNRDNPTPDGIAPEHVAVFDDLYQVLYDERPLPRELVDRLNALHRALVERHGQLSRERGRE